MRSAGRGVSILVPSEGRHGGEEGRGQGRPGRARRASICTGVREAPSQACEHLYGSTGGPEPVGEERRRCGAADVQGGAGGARRRKVGHVPVRIPGACSPQGQSTGRNRRTRGPARPCAQQERTQERMQQERSQGRMGGRKEQTQKRSLERTGGSSRSGRRSGRADGAGADAGVYSDSWLAGNAGRRRQEAHEKSRKCSVGRAGGNAGRKQQEENARGEQGTRQ